MRRKILFFSLLTFLSSASHSVTPDEGITENLRGSLGYAYRYYSYWQSNKLGVKKVEAFVPNQFRFNSQKFSKGWDTWFDLETFKVQSRNGDKQESVQLTNIEGGITYNNYKLYLSRKQNPLFKREGKERIARYSLYMMGLGYKKEWTLGQRPAHYLITRFAVLTPIFATSSSDDLSIDDSSGYYLNHSWSYQRLLKKAEGYEIYLDSGLYLSFQWLEQRVEWEEINTGINNEILDASAVLGLQIRL